MRISRRTSATVTILAAAALLAPAAGATTTADNDYIVGGRAATNPSIVQLSFGQNGGSYGCTGELIDSEWVLTAQHCTDGDEWMNVYPSNDTRNPGPAHPADRLVNSPYGDVALVHLAKPLNDRTPMRLADRYQPQSGDAGTVLGYGLRANRVPADHLYAADVDVVGRSTDAYGGEAVHVRGKTGASNHGDSGGPLIVDGVVVAVCSTGDSSDPGANTHAGSNYANLTASRAWIHQTTGV